MERFSADPGDQGLLAEIRNRLELLRLLPVEMNYWQMQNIYFKIAKTACREILSRSRSGDNVAGQWINEFRYIGEMLFFNISSVLPQD